MNLSVVIPAYNEEKDIKNAIFDVVKVYPDAEIIIVNDASTDRTLNVLYELILPKLKILVNEKNMGHGYSVVRGLKAATGDYILYIDADRQIDINSYFLAGFDIASGWRIHRQDKPFRKVISFCLKMTNLIFHRMYIKDANCPFKIYKRATIQPLLQELPQSNIIPIACLEILARKHNLRVATIQTPHKPYEGVRKGFLQILNLSALRFFSSAFFEIVWL